MARLKRKKRIFVDIDGTLTDAPLRQWGNPIASRIDRIKKMIEGGFEVVLWSGGGTEYAKAFALEHGIEAAVCIGKPDVIIDDNPALRPRKSLSNVLPKEFFGE